LSILAWLVCHRKIDDVIAGLYVEWHGADAIREKIQMLDLLFLSIIAANVFALLYSCLASGNVRKHYIDRKKVSHSIIPPCCYGLKSLIVFTTFVVSLLVSHGTLLLYVLLKVLTVFCGLPAILLMEADYIIDNLDHPMTAGFDLAKFCPHHGQVDDDAIVLFLGAALLTVSQAGMLACITSSMETFNFDLFDKMDDVRTPTQSLSDLSDSDSNEEV
jgi:hypothetical protein